MIDAEAPALSCAHRADEARGRSVLERGAATNARAAPSSHPRLSISAASAALKREVFGPVLHVCATGEPTCRRSRRHQRHRLWPDPRHPHPDRRDGRPVLARIRAGNVYVNRNIVGAVVGVQPFGGHGLSGTGPKAGGPLYLHRLCRTDRPPDLHGEQVPVAFDALRALEQALPDLPDLPPEQARRLLTRIRRYRANRP